MLLFMFVRPSSPVRPICILILAFPTNNETPILRGPIPPRFVTVVPVLSPTPGAPTTDEAGKIQLETTNAPPRRLAVRGPSASSTRSSGSKFHT